MRSIFSHHPYAVDWHSTGWPISLMEVGISPPSGSAMLPHRALSVPSFSSLPNLSDGESFWRWLAQLLDKRGSFYVKKGGRYALTIVRPREELPVLYHIQTQLNCGGVRIYPGRVEFILQGKTALRWVVEAVKRYLRNPERLEQLEAVGRLLGVATPSASFPTDENSDFWPWLAGIIDGDGHFIRREDCVGLQVTTGIEDQPLLEYIRAMLGGGNIYGPRNGNWCYYQVHKRSVIKRLCTGLNGFICNSVRLPQFLEVCTRVDVSPQVPAPPFIYSPWFGGFFDADGSVALHMRKSGGCPVPSISVANVHRGDVEPFPIAFGGNIYHMRNKTQGAHMWRVSGKEGLQPFLSYYEVHPTYFRSRKSQRLGLLREFFHLRKLKAYREESLHHGEWKQLLDRWFFRLPPPPLSGPALRYTIPSLYYPTRS